MRLFSFFVIHFLYHLFKWVDPQLTKGDVFLKPFLHPSYTVIVIDKNGAILYLILHKISGF